MGNEFDKTAEIIRSLPPNRVSAYLINLMETESQLAKKLSDLCLKAYYSNSGSDEDLFNALNDVVSENERRCLHFRNSLDSIYHVADLGDGTRRVQIPKKADFTQDMALEFDEERNILRVTLPMMLPFKPAWNAYLPDKVRRKMEFFADDYWQKHGRKVEFNDAFVLLIHHFGIEKRGRRLYRDYDNNEWSWLLNALHTNVIFNDSPATMIVMQMAVEAEESFTEVLITDAARALDTIRAIDPNIDLSIYERASGSR